MFEGDLALGLLNGHGGEMLVVLCVYCVVSVGPLSETLR